MIFLAVRERRKATIFGETYDLEPVSYPNVDLNNILMCDDPIGSILLTRHSPVLLRAQFDPHLIPGFPRPLEEAPSALPPDSTLIVIRSGGIGDHLMMSAAIRALKQQLPAGSRVWLATEKVNHSLYEGNPDVDRLFPMPVRMSQFMEADYYLDFPAASLPLYKELNLTDYCLRCFNIDDGAVEDKHPSIPDRLAQSSNIDEVFLDLRRRSQGRPLVLLHWLTSTVTRDVPLDVLSVLPEQFSDVLFIAAHEHTDARRTGEQISRSGIDVLNLSDRMKTLRDYVTTIRNCDAVVCADTCTYHIAAALEKPGLVLFGPVGADLRIRYYPTIMALSADYHGVTCTSPCGLDRIWRDDLREENRWKRSGVCPEAEEKDAAFSPCLASIEPERLIEKFSRLMDRVGYTRS